jgi:hypothetical protein
MVGVEEILSEFIDDWNAGRRPRVGEYVDRAPEPSRDELAGLINAFLEEAPTPIYPEVTLAEIRNEPATRRAAMLMEEEGRWPALLPRLRNRARIKREEVVKSLAERLGVGGAEPKVAMYYHQMESGTLDPAGVSRKVVGALSQIFGVPESQLEPADWFPDAVGAAAPEPLYMRTESVMEERLEDVAAAAPPPSPGEDWDKVDRLFRGGP